MITKELILEAIAGIAHPESGENPAAFADVVVGGQNDVNVILNLRPRDPFAKALRRQIGEALSASFPGSEISVEISEHKAAEASPKAAAENSKKIPGVKHIVAVASGKGGVGKSTVTAGLARAMAGRGLRVGILDADIYGPSQPLLFNLEGYRPATAEGSDFIVPAYGDGVAVMSIGFFIGQNDALIWRGPMAVNALRQLARQTAWGGLDFLLIDLPPGTGDLHLSIVHELCIDGAVIVSIPGRLSVSDVRRGVEMFRSEGIDVPVLGIVENMAWFSPAELPDNKYFIFGRGEASWFAAEAGIEFLGDIPIVLAADSSTVETPDYVEIATKIVNKVTGRC